MHALETTWIWFAFTGFVIIALTIDALVIGKRHIGPQSSVRAALLWTCLWICSALIFNVLLWYYFDASFGREVANTKALAFFTGYLIEKALAVDNLFAFFLVFHHFRIPPQHQQRVFSYGIWGAVIMRLLLILAGTWLVHEFHWVLYLMGIALFLTGIKMCLVKEKKKDLAETFVIKRLKQWLRITPELHGEHFWVRKNHLLYVTPLFIALIFIEISDLIFAFDSIPAIFAITTDPFIVWTSNIFAILGLRALYFVLSGMVDRFHLLKYGIALILVFVGMKMMIEPWVQVPMGYSLLVIATILVSFAWVSVISRTKVN
jgi:tellurite resistance protein TerC